MYLDIQHTALKLFRQYGIKNVSMADIAKSHAITEALLHDYYRNKDLLIAVTLNSLLRKIQLAINLIMAQQNNPVISILKIYALFVREAQHSHPIFLYSIKHNHPLISERYYEFVSEIIINFLAPLYAEAQQNGIIRKDVNVPLLLKLHSRHFDDIVHGNPRKGKIDNHEELFQLVIVTNLRGILTKENFEILESKVQLVQL